MIDSLESSQSNNSIANRDSEINDKNKFSDSSINNSRTNDKFIEELQKRLKRNKLAMEEDQERLRLAKLKQAEVKTESVARNVDITFRPVFKMARLVRDQNAVEFLAKVKLKLKAKPQARIDIIGYTDHIGDDRDNYELALDQAEKIRLFLIKSLNLPENQVFAYSKGEDDPLYTRDMEDKIKLNNRYELIFN
ncbi:OmpA family protein [Leeuwenhoekiella marinoflava]|uniref:Outer membrane protein OmpA-like peptidoglycan-associated protein n=2 Tax=Leeuwenhoekiella marinoflava TaxID=988 RepID=A0A4Q0PPN6_9FLAO|nr:OmpA family protein [Leeuwenhoekiella marinoflava]RXG32152.1 outer membrane protein OmpA-like peptidoglycan-associated protein [Leeuwenhoekiella marinoflava]SHE85254.1 Outer membrane protein OmpA [Leeuwenhoekiella marinoflava DSM 3653]